MSVDSCVSSNTSELQDVGSDDFQFPSMSADSENTTDSLINQILSDNEDEVMEGVSEDNVDDVLPLDDEDFDVNDEENNESDEDEEDGEEDDEIEENEDDENDDEDDENEDENVENLDDEDADNEVVEEELGELDEDFSTIENEIKDLERLSDEASSSQIADDIASENTNETSEKMAEDNNEPSGSEKPAKKPRKRKRKKGEAKKGEPKKKKSKKPKKSKPNNMRRNIRDIMKDDELEASTLEAQKEEEERKKRLQELKKGIQQTVQIKKEENEKDSQLKSLLQTDDTEKNDDIIMLDSSEEKPKVKAEVIDISSDEDEVLITKDEDDDVEPEDPNNAGNHINDELNVPDANGRVQINIGHPPEDPDIFLAPQIARAIKRHQIGGVRFLYDNLVESLTRCKNSAGFGCILAHSMGLGKTIQMISVIDIFLRYTDLKTVLLIVPINTLQNWMAEFNIWTPQKPEGFDGATSDVVYRSFNVYLLNDSFKTTVSRAEVIAEWYKNGGVLLMGYEMYRLLSSRRGHIAQQKKPGRKPASPAVIDLDQEDKNKSLLVGVHEALISPGPDLIVCDEGHRIKNSHAGISQSLKNIKTRRRVVLTGYPLQNNLVEYWCMVDFVRPNFLGTKTEFSNMFERPVMNGQCVDSTSGDEKLMRYRSHVLHSLLEGFVQRRGHTVLQNALPPKQEFVLLIRMSPIQKTLYQHFIQSVVEPNSGFSSWANHNPLKAFAVCCKIWNHPDILHKLLVQKKIDEDNDLDIEGSEGRTKKGQKSKKAATPSPSPSPSPASLMGDGLPSLYGDRRQENIISYDWAKELLKDFTPGLMETGGKIEILFDLLKECLAADDKVLVFSQSLFTLNLLEEFLSKAKVPRPEVDEYWCKNKNYFRLDGSTGPQERERMINTFNRDSKFWLFLLSTRAGSLGVNLVGANRVVVMDASWNPCHDCQAICRVYRFGQTKPSYIYRLITDNTMEKKIYDRQINKQGMSDRIVDELNPQNHFSRRHVDNLLHFEQDKVEEDVDFSECETQYDDTVLISVLQKRGKWLTRAPFSHESLLIDKKELRLTKKEKRLAKQSYVMEKRLNVSYTRPSYTAFYANPQGTTGPRPVAPMTIRRGVTAYPNRPVASVKPIITTPVPMRPKVGKPEIAIKGNKPGVSVHKIITTTAIMLPGSNVATQSGSDQNSNKIPAGQQIFIIKTPKGVYIRTNTGKIFAVRAKLPIVTGSSSSVAASGTLASTTTVTTASTTTTAVIKPPIIKQKAPQIITKLPVGAHIKSKAPATLLGNLKPMATPNTTDMLATVYSQSKQVNSIIKQQQDKSDTPPEPEPTKDSYKEDQYDILDLVNKSSEKKDAPKENSEVNDHQSQNESSTKLSQRPLQKIAPNLSSYQHMGQQQQMPNFFLPPVPYPGMNQNSMLPGNRGIGMKSPESVAMSPFMGGGHMFMPQQNQSNSNDMGQSQSQQMASHNEIPIPQPHQDSQQELQHQQPPQAPPSSQPAPQQTQTQQPLEPSQENDNQLQHYFHQDHQQHKPQNQQLQQQQQQQERYEQSDSLSSSELSMNMSNSQNSVSPASDMDTGMSSSMSYSMPSSSTQNQSYQGATGSNSFPMPGMSMQQGLLPGFPFAPYPFPMPQPLLMQSGISGPPPPYMGKQMPWQYGHIGGYMPPFGPSFHNTGPSMQQGGQNYHSGNSNMHRLSEPAYSTGNSSEQNFQLGGHSSNMSQHSYRQESQNYQTNDHGFPSGMQDMQSEGHKYQPSFNMMSTGSADMMGDDGMMGQNMGSWDTGAPSDGNNINFGDISNLN